VVGNGAVSDAGAAHRGPQRRLAHRARRRDSARARGGRARREGTPPFLAKFIYFSLRLRGIKGGWHELETFLKGVSGFLHVVEIEI
jgi:hypothetical protein